MSEPTTEEYAATYGVPVEIIKRAELICWRTKVGFHEAIDRAIRDKQSEPPLFGGGSV